ncbi:nitrate reductase cytochrome c-type subunit [bacterium]|nr:nitrate reductase cytochrome c-type subunit [bacterium]
MSDSHHLEESVSKGLLYCFLVVVLGVSMVGFLTGTNVKPDHLRRIKTVGPEVVPKGRVPMARSYREMRDTPRGPGSGWSEGLKAASDAKRLKPLRISIEQALKQRQQRRAYDGAPPTIPHLVQQSSAAECMACHAQGLRLGERQAQIIPHQNLTNCTQCHVSQSAAVGLGAPDPRDVPNSFVGLAPPKSGPRAWNIAPPQVPHSSFMREKCLSCHADTGSSPLRSPHPERQSCTQCHAPSAELDLRPGIQSR